MNKNMIALISLVLVIIAVVLAVMKFYTLAWIVVGLNVAVLAVVISKAGR